ncbi:LuxR family transcriptional regulator [Rhizocola hellebori]|uniref:LuxR family transcriptional regulator n=1 Tax=Rhizocola hellebori TaxID=1392758 RepID=A0A8J3QFV5_9ACTN|nr:LuxR C-terminal-related transcriptional regulator [Rhizocola hellebori]GIH09811.1 LuxR family transcriptional regulator [Rhizocola hellebori]
MNSDTTMRDRLRQVFAGRISERERIAAAMAHQDSAGVALIGAEGVGKSRLQTEAARGASPATYRIIQATTSAAMANVPFGALAEHLPSMLLSAPLTGDSLRVAAEALQKHAGKRRLVLVADDAHLLDEASAALAVRMARRGELFLLTTARKGHRLPHPIVDLWTDGLAEWIEIGELTRDDVHQILTEALCGQVDGALVQRFWEATAGNALLIRELLTAQLAAGRVVEDADAGMWRLIGDFAIPSWLAGLIDERLTAAPAECRPALELLAFTEPINPFVLGELVSADALEIAEACGVVQIERRDGQDRARLAYPIYGEVLRAVTPRLRAQRWLDGCASIVEATSHHPVDLARAARWRMESGRPPGPENGRSMVTAAWGAWSAMDLKMAEVLGRRALAAGKGATVAEPLGYSLLFTGQSAEAEAVLSQLGNLDSDDDRARVAAVRAFNLFFGLDRPAQAEALLRSTAAALTNDVARRRLIARQALLRALAGSPESTLELAAMAPGEPESRVAAGLAMVFASRAHEGVAALEGPWPADAPWLTVLADLGVVHGLLWTGRFEAAQQRALDSYDRAMASSWPFGLAVACLLRGVVARMQGRLREEIRWCREGISIGREHGPSGVLAVLLALMAHGQALTGETHLASQTLAEADRLAADSMRVLTGWTQLARTWVTAALRGDAVPLAQQAARAARQGGSTGFEALALHDMVRLGAPELAIDRLSALAGESGHRLADLYAAHARAVADSNAAALAEVSAGFAELGSPLLAAEAAAEESNQHRDDGRLAQASAATARALTLIRHCEDTPCSPALSILEAPQITPRQGEIAELAARGMSSKEIGRRLMLSVRTVENHLHSVYRKLGISTRAELGALRVLLTETVS